MIKLKLILLILCGLILFTNLNADIEIRFKINNEIVTNIDISDEKNYLIFLKPNLKILSDEELTKIAEESIIREIIKKKEIDRVYKNQENSKFIEEVKKSLFRYKNVKNENEFIKLTKVNRINYKGILTKMKYEAMWNELVFQKYSTFIKIDKKNLSEELKEKISKIKKYEYNLSEILYEVNSDETSNDKYNKILEYAKKSDFKTAATKFSISNSSSKGGEIGWVKETLLSKSLNDILSKMNNGEISKSIKNPNGYLILKVNDKREMKQVINFKKELNDLVNFEKNRQLNQFSLLFYKKLKQNIKINEY